MASPDIDHTTPDPDPWTATKAAEEAEAALNIEARVADMIRRAAWAHDLAEAAHDRAGNRAEAIHHANAAALLRQEVQTLTQLGDVLPREYFTRPVHSTRSQLTADPATMSAAGIVSQIEDLVVRPGNEPRIATLRGELAQRDSRHSVIPSGMD